MPIPLRVTVRCDNLYCSEKFVIL
ncbi:hypothetical protein PXNS11_350112 [Stutzerimonas xanthomarina]|nr:hypothetical protein PXNS11_350112 [Stutzerimonas xanthomarina]